MKSIDCTDIKALLSGLVDDEVDQQTRHEAERHLVGCAPCRTLLSEAEALNASIAADARAIAPPALSDDFMGAVLSRTVYAEAPRTSTVNLWINWTGWLAAAAAVFLAASLWVMNRTAPSTPAPLAEATTSPLPGGTRAVRNASYLRSTVYEGALEPAGEGRAPDEDAAPHESQVHQASRPPAAQPGVRRSDAENVWTAALLVDMLRASDGDGLTEAQRIREIAAYEDLIANLAEARQRSLPSDRPALFAAQSVLLSVQGEALSSGEVKALRETVAQADLAGQLYELSNRWDRASTL